MIAAASASAPGKVNLVLQVGQPDHSGYHQLFSVFDSVARREAVTITLSAPARSGNDHATAQAQTAAAQAQAAQAQAQAVSGRPWWEEVEVTTTVQIDPATDKETEQELAHLDPAQHLAVRALKEVAQNSGSERSQQLQAKQIHARLEVVKTIPMAGGMAGGSADAAAALVAANAVLQAELDDEELHRLGRRLGADVPACLAGEVTVATGYGDQIQRSYRVPTHHWVFVLAHQGLSTPEVFRHFDSLELGRNELDTELSPSLEQALLGGQVAQLFQNDLQPVAAKRDDLKQTLQELSARALPAIISGSGPTIAVPAADAEAAHALAQEIRTWPTVAATLVTTSPSAPARLEWEK